MNFSEETFEAALAAYRSTPGTCVDALRKALAVAAPLIIQDHCRLIAKREIQRVYEVSRSTRREAR